MDVPSEILGVYRDTFAGFSAALEAFTFPFRFTYLSGVVAFAFALALSFFIWRIVKGGWR